MGIEDLPKESEHQNFKCMTSGARLPGLSLALLLTGQVTLEQVLTLSNLESLQMADNDVTYPERVVSIKFQINT